MNKKLIALLLGLTLMFSLIAGCDTTTTTTTTPDTKTTTTPSDPELILATTTSTQDSGLLDALLPEFEKKTGYKVKVIAVGSGEAMTMGEKGDADVLLVHSRKAEDAFMASGFGSDRKDVMYNDFVIIGPEADPAAIKGTTDAVAAFAKIAETQSPFISRGDKSGTHTKELGIWEKAAITPAGDWYKVAGLGMGETFRMANEMKAYTLIDRATYLAQKDQYQLIIVVEGDKNLFNPYGVIQVNAEKHPNINKDGAKAFAEWITGTEGQKMIGEFGKEKWGQPLFTPSANAQ